MVVYYGSLLLHVMYKCDSHCLFYKYKKQLQKLQKEIGMAMPKSTQTRVVGMITHRTGIPTSHTCSAVPQGHCDVICSHSTNACEMCLCMCVCTVKNSVFMNILSLTHPRWWYALFLSLNFILVVTLRYWGVNRGLQLFIVECHMYPCAVHPGIWQYPWHSFHGVGSPQWFPTTCR